VKSKAEKKVADTLDYAGVKYLYESPLSLKVGKRWKTVRPDFYLPEYDLYIEYRGLTHLDDYTRKMNWKKKQYRNN
jgi:DNA helicase-4